VVFDRSCRARLAGEPTFSADVYKITHDLKIVGGLLDWVTAGWMADRHVRPQSIKAFR
jgi:hypothetical protein